MATETLTKLRSWIKDHYRKVAVGFILPIFCGLLDAYLFNFIINASNDTGVETRGVVIEEADSVYQGLVKDITRRMKNDEHDTALEEIEGLEAYMKNRILPDECITLVNGLKGECYLEAGRYEEAELVLCECVKESDSKQFKMLLGRTYMELYRANPDRDSLLKKAQYYYEDAAEPLSSFILEGREFGGISGIPILSLNDGNELNRTAHVVLIGVDDYVDPDVTDLRYLGGDIGRMQDAFGALYGHGDVNVTRLTGAQATKANILMTLHKVAQGAAPSDQIALYFAGHGLTYDDEMTSDDFIARRMSYGSLQNKQLLLPYDWRDDFPAESGLFVDDLVEILSSGGTGSPPLLVLDACRSASKDGDDDYSTLRPIRKVTNLVSGIWKNMSSYSLNINFLSSERINYSNAYFYSKHDSVLEKKVCHANDYVEINENNNIQAVVLNAVGINKRASSARRYDGGLFTHFLSKALQEYGQNIGVHRSIEGSNIEDILCDVDARIYDVTKTLGIDAQTTSMSVYYKDVWKLNVCQ